MVREEARVSRKIFCGRRRRGKNAGWSDVQEGRHRHVDLTSPFLVSLLSTDDFEFSACILRILCRDSWEKTTQEKEEKVLTQFFEKRFTK